MTTAQSRDQWVHQQEKTPEQQRAHHFHHSVTGAAAAAVADKTDKHAHPERTVDPEETKQHVPQGQPDGGIHGVGTGPQAISTSGDLEVTCGPILNYRRMSGVTSKTPRWHGSVLIVTLPGSQTPELQLRCLGSVESLHASESNQTGDENFEGANENTTSRLAGGETQTFAGEKLYADPKNTFWRFQIDLLLVEVEASWEYHIPRLRHLSGASTRRASTRMFSVPSATQSMRMMFHSCNGFSVGTNLEVWSGPVLWNDVLRMHEQQPFHVMIGGGDQLYNDGVRVTGPLRSWSNMGNPKKRRDFPFNEDLRRQCDEWYFENYIRWYMTEPFATANGQIPQINMWDDHDIIDGFGSYTDHFMKCPVFRGIGGVAYKYYLLFQHHLPPPKSTFTTDAPQTMHASDGKTSGVDAVQLKDTFVMNPDNEDPSYIIGRRPGPYVEERSRSLYSQLGANIGLLAIDARTERTRRQVNYPDTYDLLFQRLASEFTANPNIKHLILLLGIPIAYPRLEWVENILRSPVVGIIRFLNRRFGIAGSFFNHFDGSAELLDDLDDHYTAHAHKAERKGLVLRLQAVSKRFGVRVTILGGDVHLAALGRFYSNPKLSVPVENDWRYMANIVSSAITNKPPPEALANLMCRQNKIHHLDRDTDETLMNIFDHDPGMGSAEKFKGLQVNHKTAQFNHMTMPSRNYAIIARSSPADGFGAMNGHTPGNTSHEYAAKDSMDEQNGNRKEKLNPRNGLWLGEQGAGTTHPAASGLRRSGFGGEYGLDVTYRVEVVPGNKEGLTDGYGFSIPTLEL